MHDLTAAPGAARAASPEALLLARVATGDTRAFSELARLLARPALALSIRVLGDHGAAEDAVQEALARLWREARRFDPARGSFAAWWRRMLMNCALDGRRRLRPVTPLDAAAEVSDPAPGPAAHAEAAELAARVQEAAAALPARWRCSTATG